MIEAKSIPLTDDEKQVLEGIIDPCREASFTWNGVRRIARYSLRIENGKAAPDGDHENAHP